jgi:membrane-associated phospholipid phosphatase
VGFIFVHRPAEDALDRYAFKQLGPAKSPFPATLHVLLLAGSRNVAVVAVFVAFCLSVFRDWRRAIACVAGSALAIVITQIIAKPLVGDTALGFGGHSYPSGTVTAVAAYVTAITVGIPRRIRPEVVLVGIAAVCAVSGAVIAARWHFATDALGGALVGVGSVITFDGAMHLLGHNRRTRNRGGVSTAQDRE